MNDESCPILTIVVMLQGNAVFAAVHQAEILAARTCEPFGSILLALAITTLDVGLNISLMVAGGEGAEAIVRDHSVSLVQK